MNKEKEIQEIAKIVGSDCEMYDLAEHICLNGKGCETCKVSLSAAEKLYNAGYRKADEVRKDIVIDMCADLMRFLFPDGVCQIDAHNAIEFCDKWYVKAGLKPYNESAIKKYGSAKG